MQSPSCKPTSVRWCTYVWCSQTLHELTIFLLWSGFFTTTLDGLFLFSCSWSSCRFGWLNVFRLGIACVLCSEDRRATPNVHCRTFRTYQPVGLFNLHDTTHPLERNTVADYLGTLISNERGQCKVYIRTYWNRPWTSHQLFEQDRINRPSITLLKLKEPVMLRR